MESDPHFPTLDLLYEYTTTYMSIGPSTHVCFRFHSFSFRFFPVGTKGNKGDDGDVGSPGPVGRVGSIGPKGQKGEAGQSMMASPISGFYLGRHANLLITSGSQTITFDTQFTNVGNDISRQTGIFTCRIPGLYYFSFTLRAKAHAHYGLDIDLIVNNYRKAEIRMTAMSKHVMQSQSALLDLEVGDQVWLKANAATYIWGCPQHNTFIGYLIRAASGIQD